MQLKAALKTVGTPAIAALYLKSRLRSRTWGFRVFPRLFPPVGRFVRLLREWREITRPQPKSPCYRLFGERRWGQSYGGSLPSAESEHRLWLFTTAVGGRVLPLALFFGQKPIPTFTRILEVAFE